MKFIQGGFGYSQETCDCTLGVNIVGWQRKRQKSWKNEGGQLVETNHHGPLANQGGQISGGLREIFDLQNSGYEPKEIKLNTHNLISLRVSNPP